MTFTSPTGYHPNALGWLFALYLSALMLMLSLVFLKLAGVLSVGWFAALAPLWSVWLLQIAWFGTLMIVLACKALGARRRVSLPHVTPHPIH